MLRIYSAKIKVHEAMSVGLHFSFYLAWKLRQINSLFTNSNNSDVKCLSLTDNMFTIQTYKKC